MEKRCSRCQQTKPSDQFGKSRARKDGLHEHCKACRKDYYQANREREIARMAAWVKANPEKAAQHGKDWRARNRDRYLESAREGAKQRYAANPDYYKRKSKKYDSDNPHVRWARSMRRMAKRWGVTEFTATYTDWQDVLEQYGHMCYYCGSEHNLLTEHKVPFARGGQHTKDNIVPACPSCNKQKNQLTDVEYFDVLSRMASAAEAEAA